MNRKTFIGFVVIPLVATASYLGCLWCWPDFAKQVLHSERGLVEMATALAFLGASCLGLRLLVRTRGRVPMWASVIYGLFAAAGIFVALEEVSYGQKLFHWDTPHWFARTNSKRETNFHNMLGNKPSNRMRQVASIGCPVVCLILPSIACMRRGRYQPSHWTFYALPRMELATLAAISLLLTALHRLRVHGAPDIWEHTAEVRELVWSVSAVFLAGILGRRLIRRTDVATTNRSDGNVSVAPCLREAA
jgi:hypothetical protein